MKKDIHPAEYRPVLFEDVSSGEEYIISSTIKTTSTKKAKDGKEYPHTSVEISSASHPFYTGKETLIDTAGRVDKFKKRAEKAQGKNAK